MAGSDLSARAVQCLRHLIDVRKSPITHIVY